MSLSPARTALLVICTAASFVTLGRAPGAINLRTREIEAAIVADASASRADARRRADIAA